MALEGTDIAILTARMDCARTGASRFGFYPDDVEGSGTSEPGEYVWKEEPATTTQWELDTQNSVCGRRPVASFTDLPDPSEVDEVVQFTDTSTPAADITFWYWEFGDGSTSYDQHPTHTYTDPGTYTVTLYVSSSRGTSSASGTHTVSRFAHFSWETVDESDRVDYDASGCTVTIASYAWDFGDGVGTATDQSGYYPYGSYPGTYTVTLTATATGGGTDTITAEVHVGVSETGSV